MQLLVALFTVQPDLAPLRSGAAGDMENAKAWAL